METGVVHCTRRGTLFVKVLHKNNCTIYNAHLYAICSGSRESICSLIQCSFFCHFVDQLIDSIATTYDVMMVNVLE